MWHLLKNKISEFFKGLKALLPSILLLPVAPLFMWGPVTHLYLNKRALDRVTPDDTEDERVKEMLSDEKLRNTFINAGDAVDLIKANNLRNRERFFEYAHNTIPNYFTGDPVMGRYLLEEVGKLPDSEEKKVRFAWSLGWLAHQVSDGFAHKIPHAGCEGWVNSRRVLAGYFSPEREDESVSVAHARIQLYTADHWLAELLVDTLALAREREFLDSFKIDFSIPTNGEIFNASSRILNEFERELGPGYVYFKPIDDSRLRDIVDYYELLTHSIISVYRAILRNYTLAEFESMLDASPRMSRLNELLDNSTRAIEYMLKNPDNPWDPARWLPDGSNKFDYSVYDYERIWRPGKYKFGRKSGLLGAIYYNRLTDKFISWARDVSVTTDLWPLVRFMMSVMYNRGKSQWPIASVFIRVLVNNKPASVQDTMDRVAKICRLVKYEETVPD